jgi:transcriptional regulator with XRE-family HTH domain
MKIIHMKKQIRAAATLRGLPAELRDQLKQARGRRGWSQRQLGAAVGLPQPHISAIEAAEKPLYAVSEDELESGEEDRDEF